MLISARVRPEKRTEFLLSVRSLVQASGPIAGDPRMFHAIDDEAQLYCVASWASDVGAEAYLASDLFRALRGAVRTLGEGGTVRIVTDSDLHATAGGG